MGTGLGVDSCVMVNAWENRICSRLKGPMGVSNLQTIVNFSVAFQMQSAICMDNIVTKCL